VWLPTARVEVVIVATPPLSVLVPSVWLVLLSLKVTVPVGVPPLPETVAVNVTDWPTALGFGEPATVVVVGVSACAAPSDSSKIALAATTTLPIAPHAFRRARQMNDTHVKRFRAKLSRSRY